MTVNNMEFELVRTIGVDGNILYCKIINVVYKL